MSTVGVISHLPAPTLADVRALAEEAEAAGADWLGLPDAFWWRDTWLLVAEAARVTDRLRVGPVVTNPYLRHPFHTVAAVATAQDVAGDRIFVGVGAGGSEVSGSAGISRGDAPGRISELARLIRAVAAGEALDPASGRCLDVPLQRPTILVAGRGNGVLGAAGRVADQALLWAVPRSDLDRSVRVIADAAALGREAPGARPELVWAPLVDHGDADGAARSSLGYAALNSRPELVAAWGIDQTAVADIQRRLLAGKPVGDDLLPAAAVDDLLIGDPDPEAVAEVARRIGAGSLAIPAFGVAGLGDKVRWARAVLAASEVS